MWELHQPAERQDLRGHGQPQSGHGMLQRSPQTGCLLLRGFWTAGQSSHAYSTGRSVAALFLWQTLLNGQTLFMNLQVYFFERTFLKTIRSNMLCRLKLSMCICLMFLVPCVLVKKKKHLIDLLHCFISEKDLINSLPFSSQCPEDEFQCVKFLYESKLKKVILCLSMVKIINIFLV